MGVWEGGQGGDVNYGAYLKHFKQYLAPNMGKFKTFVFFWQNDTKLRRETQQTVGEMKQFVGEMQQTVGEMQHFFG